MIFMTSFLTRSLSSRLSNWSLYFFRVGNSSTELLFAAFFALGLFYSFFLWKKGSLAERCQWSDFGMNNWVGLVFLRKGTIEQIEFCSGNSTRGSSGSSHGAIPRSEKTLCGNADGSTFLRQNVNKTNLSQIGWVSGSRCIFHRFSHRRPKCASSHW